MSGPGSPGYVTIPCSMTWLSSTRRRAAAISCRSRSRRGSRSRSPAGGAPPSCRDRRADLHRPAARLGGDAEAEAGHRRERAVRQPKEHGAEEEEHDEAAEPFVGVLVGDVEDVLGQREAEADDAAVDGAVEGTVEL